MQNFLSKVIRSIRLSMSWNDIIPWVISFWGVMICEAVRIYGIGGNDCFMAFFASLSLLGIPFICFSMIGVLSVKSISSHVVVRQWIQLKHPVWAFVWMVIASIIHVWIVHTSFLLYIQPTIKRAYYQGLATALVALILCYILLLLIPIAYVLSSRFMVGKRLHSIKSAFFIPLLGMMTYIVLMILSRSIMAWKTLDFRPVNLLILYSTIILSLYTITLTPRRKQYLINASKYTCYSFLVLMPLSLWYASLHMSDASVIKIQRDTTWAHYGLSIARKLSDFDGDQRSQWFRGGDCDESNPKIRSAAYEPIGKDWNCNQIIRDKKPDPWSQTAPKLLTSQELSQLPALKPAKHLVLLTIDALRYDTFKTHMPKLQALAHEAIDFQSAYSAGAATYWSIPTLIGSKQPSRFHMGRDQTPVNQEYLLSEALQSYGFHTSLFANVTIFFVRGLRQGNLISNYDTSHYTRHGAIPGSKDLSTRIIQHIGKWQAGQLKRKKDRFFVWGHYYDPHDPYFKVNGYPSGSDDVSRYQSIVRSVDTQVVRVIKALKQKKLWQDTIVVITSDHGDEFLEHGHRFHGKTLYEEMVHVPLLIFTPGQKGIQVTSSIGHRDVVPTVLSQLGLQISKKFTGHDWSRWLQAKSLSVPLAKDPSHPVFFEVLPDRNYGKHLVGMRVEGYKMILDVNMNVYELYNLSNDPQEKFNLYGQHSKSKLWAQILAKYANDQMEVLSKNKAGTRLLWGIPTGKKKKR